MRPSAHSGSRLKLLLSVTMLGALGWACPASDASDARSNAPPSTVEDAAPSDSREASCRVPYSGLVTIIPVSTPRALERARAERPSAAIVYETPDTTIYLDGRTLTIALEDVGEHLSALGWAENPMRILGAAVAPGGVSRSSSDWRGAGGNATPRRTRRRG